MRAIWASVKPKSLGGRIGTSNALVPQRPRACTPRRRPAGPPWPAAAAPGGSRLHRRASPLAWRRRWASGAYARTDDKGRQAAPLSPICHASAAPDGPGAAPCAGVAWTAGALVSVGGRHCAGRETAPVSRCSGRAARHVPGAGVGGVREGSAIGRSRRSIRPPLAPALRAAKGVRPSALSPSPRGELHGGGPARRRARPPRQSTRLSPACQRGQRHGQGRWPRCQLRLCRVASHCWGSWGLCPQTPGRRSPSRVGVGGEVEGPHCGAVQDRRAAPPSCNGLQSKPAGTAITAVSGPINAQRVGAILPSSHP